MLFVASATLLGAACTSTTTDSATTTTAETTTDATTEPSPGAVISGSANTNATTNTATGPGGRVEDAATTVTDVNDPTFLMTAASSNMMEIELGRLAAQKGAHAEVKKFGQMMVDHHTKATQELKTVAGQVNTQLPTAMMPIHKEVVDRLAAKSGKEFDEDYMDAMETAHKTDIAMFEMKSKNAENATIKAFATKSLPMLRSHLEQATKIEDMVD